MPDVNRDRAFKLIRAAFREAVNDEVAQQAIGDCVVICQYHIEDVDLWWVIELNRGKIRFHEGRVDYAGIIFNYKHAVDFHFHTLGERSKEVKWWTGFECYGNRALQKYTSPVFHAMQRAYRKLVSGETPPPPPDVAPVKTSAPKKVGVGVKEPKPTKAKAAKPVAKKKPAKAKT